MSTVGVIIAISAVMVITLVFLLLLDFKPLLLARIGQIGRDLGIIVLHLFVPFMWGLVIWSIWTLVTTDIKDFNWEGFFSLLALAILSTQSLIKVYKQPSRRKRK